MQGYYAILAFEGEYGGMHGMYREEIVYCENEAHADGALSDMAFEVYEEYGLDAEYPEEELCADGEFVFIAKDLTKEQLDFLEQELYEHSFKGFSENLKEGKYGKFN